MRTNRTFEEMPKEDKTFFSTKAELTKYLLLKYLLKSQEPLGSWVLKIMLELEGVYVSTATIGRVLMSLDRKKLTELVEGQGRVITTEGISHFKAVSSEFERYKLQNELITAAQPQNFDQLLDLLCARRVIECETARLAALRATPEHLEALESTMKKHEEQVSNNNDPTSTAFDYHQKVAEASQNRFLIAALNILIYEELKIESHMKELVTRERGAEYAKQHRSITQAIAGGNEKEAQRQMKVHMDTLLQAIEEQHQTWEKQRVSQNSPF